VPIETDAADVPISSLKGEPGRWRKVSLAGWLFIAWCGLSVGWYASRVRLPVCPYGQGDCDRSALVHAWTGRPWPVLIAAAGTAALGVLWWWDRRAAPPRPVDLRPRPFRLGRITVVAALGVVTVGNLLLLAPKPAMPYCARTVHINQAMSYTFHCDSPEFLELARHPGNVLRPQETRQSRPGYVALAATSTNLFGGITHGLGVDQAYAQHDPAYIPLVIINMALLTTAVVLLAGLLTRIGVPAWAVASLAAMVAVNGLTKSFLWTPHQQLFALVVPVATIAFGRWVLTGEPTRRRMALAGLGAGLVALCYGSVLITLAAGAILVVARYRRAGVERAGLFLLAGVSPTLVWILVCRLVTGSYYNQEVAGFGEFVWPLVAAHDGSLRDRLVTESVKTLREVFSVALPAIALVVLLAATAVILRIDVRPRTRDDRAIVITSGITIVLAIALSWAIGFIAPRIMFHAVPPLVLLAGWLAANITACGRIGRVACAAILGTVAAITVALPFATSGVFA
jgi:hypothetical protein